MVKARSLKELRDGISVGRIAWGLAGVQSSRLTVYIGQLAPKAALRIVRLTPHLWVSLSFKSTKTIGNQHSVAKNKLVTAQRFS